jgi:hypothetical protein
MMRTTPLAGDPTPAAGERRAQKPAASDPLPPGLGDDLLRGAEAIAAFLFGDPKLRRKVYYLTGDARTRMPHFKLGAVICARKSTLLRWIEAQEARH